MAKARILVVEDDLSLAEVLSYNLRNEGYEVTLAHDGRDGLTRAQLSPPDLVILDVMLPVIDGMDVCRRLRSESATRDILILMLTAKAEELDELVGLSLGADDFVTKPFSVKVLLERIKALLRRRQPEVADGSIINCHGIVIDRSRHKVTSAGRSLELTRAEFRLLDTLIRQPGRVFQRTELIDAALGDDAIVMERTIDVHIRALRRKLGKDADVVETVRGVGYRFRDRDADESDE
jgi:two-component system phosphate regulon response regulator PhoB